MNAVGRWFENKVSEAGESVWSSCAKEFQARRFGGRRLVEQIDEKQRNTRIILALDVSVLIHFHLLGFLNEHLSTAIKKIKPLMQSLLDQSSNKPVENKNLLSASAMQVPVMLSNQPTQTNNEVIENLATHTKDKTEPSAITQTSLHKSPLGQHQQKIRINPGFRRSPLPPVYPPQAIRQHQQGTTQIRAKISRFGDVKKIIIHHSSGFEFLDYAAVAAVREWKLVPAREYGVTVASWVQVPVNFFLK